MVGFCVRRRKLSGRSSYLNDAAPWTKSQGTSALRITGSYSLGKRIVYSVPFTIEIKNECSWTSASSTCCCGKRRINFAAENFLRMPVAARYIS